jgi:hypothetical protein
MLCKFNTWTFLKRTYSQRKDVQLLHTRQCCYSSHGWSIDGKLREVFGNQVISQWPKHFPDLNPCDIYLWSMLEHKDYANNPHMAEESRTIFDEWFCMFTKKNFEYYEMCYWDAKRPACREMPSWIPVVIQGKNNQCNNIYQIWEILVDRCY